MKFNKRQCPSCLKKTLSDQEIFSSPSAEKIELEDLTKHWNGFFKEKIFFSYNRCKECDLLYNPIFFTPEQLELLYKQMPPNMPLVPVSALKRTQRGYFNALKKFSLLSGQFMEIGPDVGYFVENCVREGNYEHYWLFEPNRDVSAQLKKVVECHDHHIVHDVFNFSKVPSASVSTVVMIHVFDHLLDPVVSLRDLGVKLSADATVLIVTHDESSLLRKIVGYRWPPFCLQHPQIYNPKSIVEILNKAGYKVEHQEKTTNYFPISFLLKHLLWALGIKVKWVPSFFGLTLGLRLGNILTIAHLNK
jgi:hypothetical protein